MEATQSYFFYLWWYFLIRTLTFLLPMWVGRSIKFSELIVFVECSFVSISVINLTSTHPKCLPLLAKVVLSFISWSQSSKSFSVAINFPVTVDCVRKITVLFFFCSTLSFGGGHLMSFPPSGYIVYIHSAWFEQFLVVLPPMYQQYSFQWRPHNAIPCPPP